MPLTKKQIELRNEYKIPPEIKQILKSYPVDSVGFSIELLKLRYEAQSDEERSRNIRTRHELEGYL